MPQTIRNEAGHAIRGANKPSLAEMMATVEDQDSSLDEMLVHAGDLQVAPEFLTANGRELVLSDAAQERFSRQLGIPADYAKRMRPELRAQVQNSHLQHGEFADAKMAKGSVRVLSRGSEFVAMSRSDLGVLEGRTVVQAVIDGIGDRAEQLHVETFDFENETLRFDFVTPQVEREARPGDVLFGGLHVEHSLVGERAIQIEPFIFRLLCSNGAIVRECFGSRRGPRTRQLAVTTPQMRERQIEQVTRLAHRGIQAVEQKLTAVGDLVGKPLKDKHAVTRIFGDFLHRGRMHSNELMSLLERAWRHPMGGSDELSYFGVLNSLTWVATHRDDEANAALSDRQAAILLRLAGVFANQSVHICPSCFRVVAA